MLRVLCYLVRFLFFSLLLSSSLLMSSSLLTSSFICFSLRIATFSAARSSFDVSLLRSLDEKRGVRSARRSALVRLLALLAWLSSFGLHVGLRGCRRSSSGSVSGQTEQKY